MTGAASLISMMGKNTRSPSPHTNTPNISSKKTDLDKVKNIDANRTMYLRIPASQEKKQYAQTNAHY